MTNSLPALAALKVSAGEVPEWDLSDLVERDCPVCTSKQFDAVCKRPDQLDVVRCQTCQLVFVARAPSATQLMAFYQRYAAYKGYADDKEVRPQRLSWNQLVYHCSQSFYIEILEKTGGLSGRSLLDMGCSTGNFMQLARFKGAYAQGVEIDEAARKAAEAVGFSVQAQPPANGQFDIVTAFHVLEHLTDPRRYVADMAKLVKPEGRVLIALPNATEVRDFGAAWIGFRVDLEHLNFFDVHTLSRLLAQEGLFIEHCWQHHQPALTRTDVAPPSRRRPMAKAAWWLERLYRIASPPPHQFLEGSFSLSVIARRVGNGADTSALFR